MPHIVAELALQKGYGVGTADAQEAEVRQIDPHLAVGGGAAFFRRVAEVQDAVLVRDAAGGGQECAPIGIHV